jgi:hypothetical protein
MRGDGARRQLRALISIWRRILVKADHLGRAVEITEWVAPCRRLQNAAPRLKSICSDNARSTRVHEFLE